MAPVVDINPNPMSLNMQVNYYHVVGLQTWWYRFQEETYEYDKGEGDPPLPPLPNISLSSQSPPKTEKDKDEKPKYRERKTAKQTETNLHELT